MTNSEKPSPTTEPQTSRPTVDMVFETLLGSGDLAPKEKP